MATPEEKRLQAKRQADSAKSLAIAAKERKASEEVTEATKNLSKGMRHTITKMGFADKGLQVTVANLLENGKTSFSSALAARKVLKLQEDNKSDLKMQQQAELKAIANANIAESLNVQEQLIQEQASAVVSARETNAELKGLIDNTNTIREGEAILLASGTDAVEARLITEKALGENLRAISEKEQSIRDLSNNKLEAQTKIIEKHNKSLEIATDGENIRREELDKQLQDAGADGAFDKFSGSVKTLTGGLIDIATPLDALTKNWNALKDLGSSLQSFGSSVSKGFTKFTNGAEEQSEANASLIESQDETTGAMVKNSVIQASIGKRLAATLMGLTTGLVMMMAGIILPIIAIAAALLIIKAALDKDMFAGAGEAIKRSLNSVGKVVQSASKTVKSGFARLKDAFPKAVKTPKVPKTPVGDLAKKAGQARHPAGAVDPVTGNKIGGQFMKEGDEALKVVGKVAEKSTGFFGGLKAVSKGLIKKLPLIGAVAETGLDGFDQFEKMDDLKAARADGTLMKKDEKTGEDRAYTDEEFEELQTAYTANLAGSAGKGVGSFGGALAGGIAGAKAGAFVGSFFGPGIGTAIGGFLGGVVGAVAGGFLGGEAGDSLTTSVAETALGGSGNSQEILDQAAASIKTTEPDTSTALINGQVNLDDQIKQAVTSAISSTSIVSDNSNNASNNYSFSPKSGDSGSTVTMLNPVLN